MTELTRVLCIVVDQELKFVGVGGAKVLPTAVLAEVVAAVACRPPSPQFELFAARNGCTWLTFDDIIEFTDRPLKTLERYMTASSALHGGCPVSVFQSAPDADNIVHLILRKLPENEAPLVKKQKTTLFQLAQDMTPSSFAKASGNGGWLVRLKQHPGMIDCHRVAMDAEVAPLPLVLQHPVFAQFQDDCQHIQIGTEDCTFVETLCKTLSQSYEDEPSFAEAACRLVSSYLGVHFMPSATLDTTRDDPIHHNRCCPLHLVCKLERGGSGGDPLMRNIVNYLKRLPQRIDQRMPCFLLDLCGPYMALFGICNTSDTHAVCEPLMCGFPLTRVNDEVFMTSLVRAWASLKKGVAALVAIEDDITFLTPASDKGARSRLRFLFWRWQCFTRQWRRTRHSKVWNSLKEYESRWLVLRTTPQPT